MYTYEVYTVSDNQFGYKIYRINEDGNKELLVDQPFNPETGQPFTTEDEAIEQASKIVEEYNIEEMKNNPPHLKVEFTDEAGNPINITSINTPINVKFELYYPNDDEIIYAPVTGDYIVTYFYKDSDTPVGSVKVHVENGQGSGKITITKSGVFEIKLDKILNAETMQQPNPLPILDKNPVIAVVESLE